MARVGFDSRRAAGRREEIVHGRLQPGADVEDAAVSPDGGEDRRDDVADVDEVARLAAVAEDRHLVARAQPVHEDRDDAALELGELPRPVDVREAEHEWRLP